jgi:hypothetical protein
MCADFALFLSACGAFARVRRSYNVLPVQPVHSSNQVAGAVLLAP